MRVEILYSSCFARESQTILNKILHLEFIDWQKE
jgi:hypothetical protein